MALSAASRGISPWGHRSLAVDLGYPSAVRPTPPETTPTGTSQLWRRPTPPPSPIGSVSWGTSTCGATVSPSAFDKGAGSPWARASDSTAAGSPLGSFSELSRSPFPRPLTPPPALHRVSEPLTLKTPSDCDLFARRPQSDWVTSAAAGTGPVRLPARELSPSQCTSTWGWPRNTEHSCDSTLDTKVFGRSREQIGELTYVRDQLYELQGEHRQLQEANRTSREEHVRAEAALSGSLQESQKLVWELKQELARSRESAATEATRHGEAVQSFRDRLQRCEDQVEFERGRTGRHRRAEEQLAAKEAQIKNLQRERDQLQECRKLVDESQGRRVAEEDLRARLTAAQAAAEQLWEERVTLQRRVAELEASQLRGLGLQDSEPALDQHQALKDEVAALRAQLQDEQASKKHMQDTLSERERACRGLAQESEFLKSQNKALNAKLQQSRGEAAAQAERVGRCLQCEDRLKSIRSLEDQILDLQGQLWAVQQEREAAVVENRNLREREDDTSQGREELQRQLQALEAERLKLVADNEKLQTGDREHIEATKSLEDQLGKIQGQLQDARSEHEAMAAENARLKAWGEQHLADVRLLEGQLEDSRARLRGAHSKEQMEDLQSRLRAAKEELKSVAAENDSLVKKEVAAAKSVQALEGDLQDAKGKLQATREEQEALAVENSRLKAKVEEHRRQQEALEKSGADTERTWRRLVAESDVLKSQSIMICQKLKEAQEAAAARSEKVKQCEETISLYEDSMKKLGGELESVQGQLQDLYQERQVLVAHNSRLKAREEELQWQEENLVKTCRSTEKERKGLAETNSSLQSQNLSLSVQLTEARAESAWQASRARSREAQLEDLQATVKRLQEELIPKLGVRKRLESERRSEDENEARLRTETELSNKELLARSHRLQSENEELSAQLTALQQRLDLPGPLGTDRSASTEPPHPEKCQEIATELRCNLGHDACIVCVLGGTELHSTDSEALVKAIAPKLEAAMGSKAKFVTEGMAGVQETFAKHCGDGSSVWNLLPAGQSSSYGRGVDINAGADTKERNAIFGLIGDIYITVEGGPDVSQGARAAYVRGAAVVPLIRTGGASSGMFDFPRDALQKHRLATQEQWSLLKSNDAPVEESAAAVVAVVEALAGASVAEATVQMQREAVLEALRQNEALQQEVVRLREALLLAAGAAQARAASPSSLGYTCESLPETVGSSLASPGYRGAGGGGGGGSSRLEGSWLVSGSWGSGSGLGACPEDGEEQQQLGASIATNASDLDVLRGVLQDAVA